MELNKFSFSAKNVNAAIKYLKGKGKEQPAFLKNRQFKVKGQDLFTGGKMVIPDEKRDAFLRELVYGDKKFPFGRDSLFHMTSQAFVNLSRRFISSWLQKQGLLQQAQHIPPTTDRGSYKKWSLGQIQVDLVHLQEKDVNEWGGFVEPKDKFFLTAVEISTNYFDTRLVDTKEGKPVADAMKSILKTFNKHFKVRSIAHDNGSEFNNKFWNKMVEDAGVKDTNIPSRMAPAIESRNALFQRYFFLLMRQKRYGLAKTIRTTVDILNNIVNRRTGMTPAHAVTKDWKTIQAARKKRRKPVKVVSKTPLEVGTKVRILTQSRKERGFYKSYRQTQWSKSIYTITARKKMGNVFKYRANDIWYFRNDLLVAPIDTETEKLLKDRKETIDVRPEGSDPTDYVPDIMPDVKKVKRAKRKVRYKVGDKIVYNKLPGYVRGVNNDKYRVEYKQKGKLKFVNVLADKIRKRY